jgi:hypothetical protein
MRWEDERYVRWYTRNTPEWNSLPWQARGLFGLILRELDRAGILELGRLGLKAVAVQIRADWEDIEKPLMRLLDDGMLLYREDAQLIVAPNFIEAQECHQSDRARQRSARERARDIAKATSHGVTAPSRNVTPVNGSVTESHAESQDVTGCHSVPSRAVPNQPSRAVPSDPESPLTPEEQTRIRALKSDRPPPPPGPETGYDLAKRVWRELWEAKYKRPYIFAMDIGPNSEDRILQRLGFLANEQGKNRAEEFCRHWVKAYLRSHGDKNWLDNHSHPLRSILRDIAGYGCPKPAPSRPRNDDHGQVDTGEATGVRKLVSVAPSETDMPLEEHAKRAAEFMKRIGTGGAK